ncbi:MAG: sigma-70 family RNA polymerase sigma factor [Anaerolineae bacterium]|nr:sigma-70 family RNA polymerase sigma factor [Anaerolineae bacterium]
MSERTERTNEAWLAALRGETPDQPEALEDLRSRLQRGIFYYLSRERSDLAGLSNHDVTQMAQDMAQDALMRVIENLESFRGDSLFTTWAMRVAVRVAISDLRRARYRDFSLDALTAESEPAWLSLNPVAGDKLPLPERAAEQREVLTRLQESIHEALTDRQYQALVAVAVNNVPMEVVAERMGTNRNALYKLVHDARRKLRAHLESQGMSMDYMMRLFEDR